jgi:hypothetical protein
VTRRLKIDIPLPEAVSDEALQLARELARETVILTLQQQGELTIREAAAGLGLTYSDYLSLLADRGLPAANADTDPAVLEKLRRSLQQNGAPTR